MTHKTAPLCAANVRSLPVALAHVMSARRPGDPALVRLNATYARLAPAEQLQCRAELLEVKASRRGEREAQVLSRGKPCASS